MNSAQNISDPEIRKRYKKVGILKYNLGESELEVLKELGIGTDETNLVYSRVGNLGHLISNYEDSPDWIPTLTAQDLLDKLPKTLELEDSGGLFQYCSLNIRPGDKKSWCVMYYCETSPLITFEDDSLLVAAYECLKWIYTNELARS